MMVHKHFLKALLYRKILYLGERNYLLGMDEKPREIGAEPGTGSRLLILGKKHYFETTRVFPFTSLKEIKAAIAMDLNAYSPLETATFFVRRIESSEGKTTVNLWFVDREIEAVIKRLSPLFIVPESCLFSSFREDLPHMYVVRQDQGKVLLVYVDGNWEVRSLLAGDRGTVRRDFRRLIGARANDCPTEEIPSMADYLARLSAVVAGISLKNLLGFVNSGSAYFNFDRKNLQLAVAVAAGLFLLYTGASTALLYHTAGKLQRENQVLSERLKKPLQQQAELHARLKQQRHLAGLVNGYAPRMTLLNLLDKVLPPGTIIRRLTIADQMVEMRGSTPGASALLTALSRSRGVSEAGFSSPVRENEKTGLKMFTLTFIYQPAARGDEHPGGEQ